MMGHGLALAREEKEQCDPQVLAPASSEVRTEALEPTGLSLFKSSCDCQTQVALGVSASMLQLPLIGCGEDLGLSQC